ncbi:MAG: YdcF family protein [Solirubrobacterales bacterium]
MNDDLAFTLSKLLWVMARPSSILLILLLVGLALGRRRAGRGLALAAALALAAIAVLPLGEWIAQPLENRFPLPADMPAHVDGILVLGGAVDPGMTEARGLPALRDSAARMTTFVALARRYPNARLAFTGGNGGLTPGALTEAEVAAQLFESLGLDRSRVVYENRSRNTWENAVLTRELMAPRAGETWILVTSALHMPRSVGCFRRAGWPVVPYPAHYQTRPHHRPSLEGIDLADELVLLDRATHEWMGLLAYHVMGRTEAWFPSH